MPAAPLSLDVVIIIITVIRIIIIIVITIMIIRKNFYRGTVAFRA